MKTPLNACLNINSESLQNLKIAFGKFQNPCSDFQKSIQLSDIAKIGFTDYYLNP